MKKTLNALLACGFLAAAHLFGATAALAASDHGTEAEAQDMVKRAVALIKTAGAQSAYKTFTEHSSPGFKDRDMYVWVYDFNGNCLAHGANAKMLGKNLLDLKDIDGKEIIKGQVDVVKTKGSGWYGPFKFSNPVTSKIETKQAYCARGAGDSMVCSGVYSGQN